MRRLLLVLAILIIGTAGAASAVPMIWMARTSSSRRMDLSRASELR